MLLQRPTKKKTPNKPKKSVSFTTSEKAETASNADDVDPIVSIQEIERLEDTDTAWYSPQDFDLFQRRDAKMVKLMYGKKRVDPNRLEFMLKGKESPRGLENSSPQRVELTKSRQQKLMEVCTLEKLMYLNLGLAPEKAAGSIAQACEECTRPSTEEALALANRDAQFVKDHILSLSPASVRRRTTTIGTNLLPSVLEKEVLKDDNGDERPSMLERAPAMLNLIRYETV